MCACWRLMSLLNPIDQGDQFVARQMINLSDRRWRHRKEGGKFRANRRGKRMN